MLQYQNCSMVKKLVLNYRRFYETTLEYSFENYKNFLDEITDKVIKSRYSKNKLHLIKYLALNGRSSTWQIGKSFNMKTENLGENLARKIILHKKSRGN